MRTVTEVKRLVMMLGLVGLAGTMSGCAHGSDADRWTPPIRMQPSRGESWAYHMTTTTSGGGMPSVTERTWVFVSGPWLQSGFPNNAALWSGSQQDVRVLLPTFNGLGRPQQATWYRDEFGRVSRRAVIASTTYVTYKDEFLPQQRFGPHLMLQIHRRSNHPLGSETEFAGSFNQAFGRYDVLQSVQHFGVQTESGVETRTIVRELIYNQAASNQRTRRGGPGSEGLHEWKVEYVAFLAAHPAHMEILGLIAGLENQDALTRGPLMQLRFHLRRDAALVWRLVLSQDSHEVREHFVESMGPELIGTLSHAVVAVIVEAPHFPELDAFLLDLRSETARPLFEHLRQQGAENTAVAFARLEVGTADLEAAAQNPSDFLDIGETLLQRARADSVFLMTLVPVLIELVSSTEGQVRAASLRWLETLTHQRYDDDSVRWRRFWDDHETLPYTAWLRKAVEEGEPWQQVSALQALLSLDPETEGYVDAARMGFRQTSPTVWLLTMVAEARRGSAGALSTIIGIAREDGPPRRRELAFVALAEFGLPGSLGYDPYDATERERLVAAHRLYVWSSQADRNESNRSRGL